MYQQIISTVSTQVLTAVQHLHGLAAVTAEYIIVALHLHANTESLQRCTCMSMLRACLLGYFFRIIRDLALKIIEIRNFVSPYLLLSRRRVMMLP